MHFQRRDDREDQECCFGLVKLLTTMPPRRDGMHVSFQISRSYSRTSEAARARVRNPWIDRDSHSSGCSYAKRGGITSFHWVTPLSVQEPGRGVTFYSCLRPAGAILKTALQASQGTHAGLITAHRTRTLVLQAADGQPTMPPVLSHRSPAGVSPASSTARSPS